MTISIITLHMLIYIKPYVYVGIHMNSIQFSPLEWLDVSMTVVDLQGPMEAMQNPSLFVAIINSDSDISYIYASFYVVMAHFYFPIWYSPVLILHQQYYHTWISVLYQAMFMWIRHAWIIMIIIVAIFVIICINLDTGPPVISCWRLSHCSHDSFLAFWRGQLLIKQRVYLRVLTRVTWTASDESIHRLIFDIWPVFIIYQRGRNRQQIPSSLRLCKDTAVALNDTYSLQLILIQGWR